MKKSLIIYSSTTGNTEKIAITFKSTFIKKGWDCDMHKIDRKTDINHPPFNFDDYDFLCVGSPVILGLPAFEIINILTRNPLSGHYGQPTIEELVAMLHKNPDELPHPPARPPKDRSKAGKIIPGPKCGIVFVTYGGIHLGPKEALPALTLLEVEMEHLKFKCIGTFSCPGKHGNQNTPEWWHGDTRNRPSERDLKKAEIFMEEKIEELHLP